MRPMKTSAASVVAGGSTAPSPSRTRCIPPWSGLAEIQLQGRDAADLAPRRRVGHPGREIVERLLVGHLVLERGERGVAAPYQALRTGDQIGRASCRERE